MFGCDSYGRNGCCPPEVPSVPECRELFAEYDHVLILQVAGNPDDRKEWSRERNLALLHLERELFLAGHHKALLLFMDECRLCDHCPGTRRECRNPLMARPSPESLAVDLFETVRSAGFSIEVLTGYRQEMKRYAFLLVE
jgi:predicted metal-binding protein